MGELGPLDTQIDKPNEILSAESGLDLLQALEQVKDSSFESFEQQMISIIRHSNGVITTKVAAEIASSLTVGIFNPISAQIDPLRLGVVKRAIEIGLAYGNRLKSDNVKPGTVKKLVHDYPAYGFVIDQSEAKDLFENVRSLDANEAKLLEFWEFILRVPAPDATRYNRLWFYQLCERDWADLHGLLSQSIEQFAPRFGAAAIEPKGELIQVIVQMLYSNCPLVGAKQPSFQQRDHTMDARQ